MKILTVLLFLFSSVCFAQKKEIVLVGAIHNTPDSIAYQWMGIKEEIKKFSPTIFCVEYWQPSDTASLRFAFNASFFRQIDSLSRIWGISGINNIASQIQNILTDPKLSNDVQKRIDLFKLLYVQPDRANMDYQAFILKQLYENGETTVQQTIEKDSSVWRIVQSRARNRANSEFYHLVFPLAREMKIPVLHPVDYQGLNREQSTAVQKMMEDLANTPSLKKWQDSINEFTKREEQVLKSNNAIRKINSPEWLAYSHFIQTKVLADINNPFYNQFVNTWMRRNEIIANNIHQVALTQKGNKMAVFYGYMHIIPIKIALEKLGYTVKLLPSIL